MKLIKHYTEKSAEDNAIYSPIKPLKNKPLNAQTILSQLIAFPVLGGQSNLSIANYITSYLADCGVDFGVVPNETADKELVYARIGPAVDGGIILSGHTDVVPVAGQDWDTDPFVLTEKDGKLYGRGSCDMKGFLACCLALVPEMQAAKLKRPIYLAFSYDEEVGCQAGDAMAQAIKDAYTEQPHYAIIGEPSMMQPIVGHKGIAVFKTTVYGSAGHSSRIRQEVSALHEAARLVMWLEEKMNALVAAGRLDERFTPPHSSIHVGQIQGGIAPNVIADKCTFYWDARNIPMDSIADIKADFDAYTQSREKELQARSAQARIVTVYDHPMVPALNTTTDQAVVALIQQLSGVEKVDTVAYASEAGQFSNAGFQSVVCGPGSIAQAHRANEFISKEQLDKGVEFIRRIIAHSCV